MKAIYREMCPNCEERISDERLIIKHPCEKCLNDEVSVDEYFTLLKSVRDSLALHGTLKEWEEFLRVEIYRKDLA